MFGLFESETVVSVSTSFSRVIEDRLIPNSIKTGTIKGLLKDEGEQLVENIMEDLVSSMGAKGERLYRYGKTSYPYGAPTSKIIRSSSLEQVVSSLMSSLIGHVVTLDYAQYAPLNRQHYGWQRLQDTYGYNPVTNELAVLSTQKGFPVYLDDMQVFVTQDKIGKLTGTGYAQWGNAATSGATPLRPYGGVSKAQTLIGIDSLASEDYLKVSVIWKDTIGIKTESFTIPVMVPVNATDFVQVRFAYKVEDHRTPGFTYDSEGQLVPTETIYYKDEVQYFTYQIGEGTHIELDALYSTEFDDLGSFFPFGYFRFNKTPTSTDPHSAEYKAQVKFMKYLNLGYKEINEAINANPQIGDVESAMLMLIVPALTTNQVENKYLFDFFREIYAQTGGAALGNSGNSARISGLHKLLGQNKPDKLSLVIQDSRFVTSLGSSGIYHKIVPGVIGPIGTYTSAQRNVTTQYVGQQFVDGSDSAPTEYTWETTEPGYIYCKQITESLYEEVQVTNLRMTYQVWGGHATTNTMIPLDHAITQNYPLPEREELYARSLHYVFNSKQETEVAWYQQGWFSTVLIIIAVVWTIWSLGSDGGSGLGAAIAAGTATLEMIVMAIVIAAIEYIAITLIAKLFVKLFGPEFALLVAVAAAAYGMYSSSTSAAGSLDSMVAKDLLSVSNSMISEVSAGYKKDFELLVQEGEAFNVFAQSKMDELKKIQEELEGSHILSPFTLFGESPSNYYSRTVHAGNIGVLGISAIENYCSMALRLPELTQTVDFGQA